MLRTELDGTFTTLADSYDHLPLSSPNDVVVSQDGAIWFTDPTYGLNGRARSQSANRLYRIDPTTREVIAVFDGCDQPNGLCFAPGERQLYLADSGAPHQILILDVLPGGQLSHARTFAAISPGVPDGIRCDAAGRLWVCAGDGVQVYGSDGVRLGKILLRRVVSNCCFGGKDGRTLFMTSADMLWSIELAR